MASIINSTTTAGVTVTGDNSGSLQLATNNGTTAVTIDTSQNVSTSKDATFNTVRVGLGNGSIATNTVVGQGSALASITTGQRNVGVGNSAGVSLTTGNGNIAIGSGALATTTTGTGNTAVGSNDVTNGAAMQLNTTGSLNTAIGVSALFNNTTASNNTAVGYQAGYSITTGEHNTCMGYQAGSKITTGTLNVAIGRLSMDTSAAITGEKNNAVGNGTLRNVTSGNANQAIGSGVLQALTTGSNNVGVGDNALRDNTTASNNTAVGDQAGYLTTTGGTNVFLGRLAGNNVTTGFSNVCIGNSAEVAAAGNNNEIVIGNSATGKGSGTGFIYPNGGGVFQGNNSSTWSVTSDIRLKKNIVDNNDGLDIISQIQVRNFEYRLPQEVTDLPQNQAVQKSGVQLGVIAQELQAICPDCVTEQTTGVLSVDSDEIFWHMVNAIKELKATVDAQAVRIAELEGAK